MIVKLPNAPSAGIREIKYRRDGTVEGFVYDDMAGHDELKNPDNTTDAINGETIPFHAILLAALAAKSRAHSLAMLQYLGTPGNRAFLSGVGWVDSVRLEMNSDGTFGAVPISAIVGWDKGQEVIATEAAANGGTPDIARTFQNSKEINNRLERTRRIIDARAK